MRYQINITKKIAGAIRSTNRFSRECIDAVDRSLKKGGDIARDIKSGKLEVVLTITTKRKK